MRQILGLITLALVGGCKNDLSLQQKAARDAVAVAQVLAAQKIAAPVQPISPQPITDADVEARSLAGAGCVFLPGPQSAEPVALAQSDRALLKLDDELEVFAADVGGQKFEAGAWHHYLGKRYTLTLERDPGAGIRRGVQNPRYGGRITVRDAHDRVAFMARGLLDCGSGSARSIASS